MREIKTSEIAFGKPLPYDLYDGHGELFRRAGHVLQPMELEESWERLRKGVFTDAPVDTGRLRIGQVLDENVHDPSGRLLLAKGTQLNQRHIELIRKFCSVAPMASDEPIASRRPPNTPPEEYETRNTRRLDEQVLSRGIDTGFPKTVTICDARLPLESLLEACERYEKVWDRSAARYAQFAEDMLAGRSVAPNDADALLDDFIRAGSRDRSLPLLMLKRELAQDDYMHTHALNVAVLSMSVALRMGYGERAIKQLGIGALFQDIGMLRIPREVRLATRPLNDEEWAEVRCHPIYTIDTLERSGIRATTSLFVGYQSHERADASGYPRRRDARFIHPLSQLAGLTDAYAAMTEPRPHRPAMLPYEAVKTILLDTKHQRFNPQIVRALLDCVSLFPVGSLVELTDGSSARVVRANPGQHTLPVITPVRSDGRPTGQEIDLAGQGDLAIARPLADGESGGDPAAQQPAA